MKDLFGNPINKQTDEVGIVYEFYKSNINNRSLLTDSAKLKIKTRLKKFKVIDLNKAISNFSQEDWWMENNSHRGLAWFFHSDDRIDQFINLKVNIKKTITRI